MLGYAIFNTKVTNPEDYKEYLQQVTVSLEKRAVHPLNKSII